MNDPFAGLSRTELESLLKRTLIYAVWLLKHYGNARHHPDLDPQDLVHRVIDDTLAGRRNWDPGRQTRQQFTRGCIRSYISHFFESIASHVYTYDPEYFEDPSMFTTDTDTPWDRMTIETIQSTFEEQNQPDLLCEFRELLAEVTVAVESHYPDMIPLWTLVRDENLNLKHDRQEICNRLNLDPTTGGPDYQRYNRMRNKLERVVESCRSTDPNGGAP